VSADQQRQIDPDAVGIEHGTLPLLLEEFEGLGLAAGVHQRVGGRGRERRGRVEGEQLAAQGRGLGVLTVLGVDVGLEAQRVGRVVDLARLADRVGEVAGAVAGADVELFEQQGLAVARAVAPGPFGEEPRFRLAPVTVGGEGRRLEEGRVFREECGRGAEGLVGAVVVPGPEAFAAGLEVALGGLPIAARVERDDQREARERRADQRRGGEQGHPPAGGRSPADGLLLGHIPPAAGLSLEIGTALPILSRTR